IQQFLNRTQYWIEKSPLATEYASQKDADWLGQQEYACQKQKNLEPTVSGHTGFPRFYWFALESLSSFLLLWRCGNSASANPPSNNPPSNKITKTTRDDPSKLLRTQQCIDQIHRGQHAYGEHDY